MQKKGRLQFAGVELYFEDLPKAMKFYAETLGLELSHQRLGHHARFNSDGGFICLERKGVESFPSQDKALIFFEVADLEAAINGILVGCLYAPNGNPQPGPKFDYKLA